MKQLIKNIRIIFWLLIGVVLSFSSCSKENKEVITDYVNPMKSEVLIDKAIGESWVLMKHGQQLADQGKSINEIIKTLPKGTLLQTNSRSILFFIEGSMPMIITLGRKNKKKKQTKRGGSTTNKSHNTPLSLRVNTLAQKTIIDYDDVIDVIASDRGDDERQSKKALIIAPFNGTDFKGSDDADVAYKYLKRNRNYRDNIVFLKDDNITLEDFASFGEYDLVHLSTHGENLCGLKKINIDENGWVFMEEMPFKDCVLKVATNIKNKFTDLENDEIQIAEAIKLYQKYNGTVLFDDDGFYLLNSFFFNNFSGLKNKIWVFSACELGSNNFFEATIDYIHTDGHFLYWSNSVKYGESCKAFEKFYENLSIKGLDVSKAYKEIPVVLRENLPTTVDYTITVIDTVYRTNPKTKEKDFKIIEKDSTITKDATTRLLHLQTDDPRHGIEIIDMLNPENKNPVQKGDFYQIAGDFNDGKDEALTLKVKLIGYTKAEFLEKQMSLSLEVDGVSVLSRKPFLPDVKDDNITVKPIKEHEYGVIVTIKDIAINDVGKKKKLTLKASLHVNNEHVSIHKERVSIVFDGIIATMKSNGVVGMKFIYDDKTKAVKADVMDNVLYYDDKGYTYMKTPFHGWQKMNASELGTGLKIGKNKVQGWGLDIPIPSNTELNEIAKANTKLPAFIDFAINWRARSFESSKEFNKTIIKYHSKEDCSKFIGPKGMTVIFSPSGKLLEFSFGEKFKIKYEYGNYNVILPEATKMDIMACMQHNH